MTIGRKSTIATSTTARTVEVETSLPCPPGLTSTSHHATSPTTTHGRGRRALNAASASTAKPRWWVQEIGLRSDPAQPTTAVAVSQSPTRAAFTPRHSATTSTAAATDSHTAVRTWPGPIARATTPSAELLAGSSTRPMRSELKMSSVQ